MRGSSLRLPVVLLLSAVLCAATRRAHAGDDDEQRCVDRHADAQRARRDGRPLAARRFLEECAASACPRMIADDCTRWAQEIEALIPSVAIVAVGPDGRDVRRVRVVVDGEVLLEELDGKATPVDAGERRFRFEMDGAPPVERSLLIREGERARRVEVRFSAAAPAATPLPVVRKAPAVAAGGGSPGPWPFVVGGVGLVALGIGVGFGVHALATKADLDDRSCAPGCPQDDVDAGERAVIVADVAGAIGLVSLGVAVVLLVTRTGATSAVPAARVAPAAVAAPHFVF